MSFTPEEFLNLQVDEANSTVSTPCPAGEYVAQIADVKARKWQSKEDPTKQGMALDVLWEVDDANVKAFLERDKVTVKQGIMLDLTELGGVDTGKGKNVSLGRLREAVGLNVPGQAFSFNQLKGRVAKVAVSHRSDDRNPELIYAEVKAVAKI
jgi:hypothetical protein